MIDYRLHVFRRVAEMQSLTKASKALHLSQPAVTKHIKLLEEELRLPLFVRSSSGVTLTEAGTIFLQHVQETERARAHVLEKLQALAGRLTGRLRLGSSMTITSYYLPEVLLRFKTKYPSVMCDVVEGNTDSIIGLLLNQRIELGLVEGPCRRREIQARPFYEDEMVWIAAPSDPLVKIHQPTAKALLDRPIISRELGSGTRRVLKRPYASVESRSRDCEYFRNCLAQKLSNAWLPRVRELVAFRVWALRMSWRRANWCKFIVPNCVLSSFSIPHSAGTRSRGHHAGFFEIFNRKSVVELKSCWTCEKFSGLLSRRCRH